MKFRSTEKDSFFHTSYHRLLGAIQEEVLVDYLFYIQLCENVNPKLLIYPFPSPFPFGDQSLYLKSESVLCFINTFICIICKIPHVSGVI